MPLVVRMARENCTCAIDLLGQDQAGELVREGHRSQREKVAAAFGLSSRVIRPAICRTDGEHNMLRSFSSPRTQQVRESLGAYLPAACVQQQDRWCGAALLAANPIKKRSLGAEGLGSAMRNPGAALQIVANGRLIRILRSGRRTDVSEGDLH